MKTKVDWREPNINFKKKKMKTQDEIRKVENSDRQSMKMTYNMRLIEFFISFNIFYMKKKKKKFEMMIFFWSQNLKNQTWLNKLIKQHQLIHKAKKKHKKKKIEFDGKTKWVPVKNVLLKKYVEGLSLFARSYSTNSAIAMNKFTAVLGLEINTKLSIWNTIVPKSFLSRSPQSWREALLFMDFFF